MGHNKHQNMVDDQELASFSEKDPIPDNNFQSFPRYYYDATSLKMEEKMVSLPCQSLTQKQRKKVPKLQLVCLLVVVVENQP